MKKKKNTQPIIELISDLHLSAENSALNLGLFETKAAELQVLMEYFKTTPMQTLFLSGVLYLGQSQKTFDLFKLADYYDFPRLNMTQYALDWEALEERRFIINKTDIMTGSPLYDCDYELNPHLLDWIVQQKPMAEWQAEVRFKNQMELFEWLFDLYKGNPKQCKWSAHFPEWFHGVLTAHSNFELVSWLLLLPVTQLDRVLLGLLIWDEIQDSSLKFEKIMYLFESKTQWWSFREALFKGTHVLITEDLIVLNEFVFPNNMALSGRCINKLTELELIKNTVPYIAKYDNNELFLEGFDALFAECSSLYSRTKPKKDSLFKTIEMNTHLSLVSYIQSKKYDKSNEMVLYLLAWQALIGKDLLGIDYFSNTYFDNSLEKVQFIQSLHSSENELLRSGYVTLESYHFFNQTQFSLEETGIRFLNQGGLQIVRRITKQENVINHSAIVVKQLHYPQDLLQQIELISGTLQEENLQRVQQRLKDKGLSQGINILLHGFPGTGKTQSVYQIASQTQRNIVKVDISNTKSMWYGESEKKVKSIFTDYYELASNSKRLPILLFNEADAVISRRSEHANSSSADKVTNSLQNILLDEIENFTGILFATTNLILNIDSAFDRRFLFKVQFNHPSIEAQSKIWQSIIPTLLPKDCKYLAEQFQFSGGQIENIARKIEIHQILISDNLPFDLLIAFCNQEKLERNRQGKRAPLGF